jgi:hypothetical protein
MTLKHGLGPGAAEKRTEPAGDEGKAEAKAGGWALPIGGALLQRKIRRRLQQRAATMASSHDPSALQAIADRGTEGSPSPLPFQHQIQESFGRHDVGAIGAFVGGPAQQASEAIGAEAYATGDKLAFRQAPDLHTAAHEAAHVVQQRGGVQLRGGVGEAGDAHEQHADAVADLVVRGHSAEHLLDAGAGGGAPRVVQRKQAPDDAKLLGDQAALRNTDVEIPALEGALLAGRLEALHKGLLSRASFDAGLALSQRMTQLQPAVNAKAPVNADLQARAATAAQQLYAALQQETDDDKNFQTQADSGGGISVKSKNPYTGASRITTLWITNNVEGYLQRLPALIRTGRWGEAFGAYRRLSQRRWP